MLYGMETVALTARQEIELELGELRMLRRALGITRNEYIIQMAKVVRIGRQLPESRQACVDEGQKLCGEKNNGNGVYMKKKKRKA